VIVGDEDKLKLGKGVAFVESRLKRLPTRDETWEADFEALPEPIDQSVTHYRGMVVTKEDGSLLFESHVHGRPSVDDLATILAHAMRRPLDGDARRPNGRFTTEVIFRLCPRCGERNVVKDGWFAYQVCGGE
jgi:hypothetical protein